MSYSNSGGGTLTLPSPTHVRHVDVTSAVRSLRRSLSRSPSRFALGQSPGQSPKSPLSPTTPGSPSPSKLGPSPMGFPGATTHAPSPLATPFPPSVKLSLRSARHKTPNTHPKRTSPRSPLKRVLSESLARANSQVSTPTMSSSFNDENAVSRNMPNLQRKSFEKKAQQKSIFSIEIPPPVNQPLARLDADIANGASAPSPLKRSDTLMSLDQAALGTPLAKRRSVHGSSSFDKESGSIFGTTPTQPNFDIHEDSPMSNNEPEPAAAPTAAPPPIFSPSNMLFSNVSMPKRSSSLRKSTLQQRQEKKSASWHRRQAMMAEEANGFNTPQKSKDRPRLSMDQFMPPSDRGSPFTSGPLPNPSAHMMFGQPPVARKEHPLAREMTSSSSSGSLSDESPTHVPVNFNGNPRPRLDFSKSLPAGSFRPQAIDALRREEFGSNEVSTPENFRSAKPLPAAFMSTGLISKVNHHPEQPPLHLRHLRKSTMPDTPCKKPIGGFHTMPSPGPGSIAAQRLRSMRHSFGTPSAPLSLHGSNQGSAVARNVFGSEFGSNRTRRESFHSIISDDNTSSDNIFDSVLTGDNDMPPTPTKATSMSHEISTGSPRSMRGSPFQRPGGMSRPTLPRTSSKLCLLTISCEADGDEELDVVNSPTVFRSSTGPSASMPSFSRSRARKGSKPPAPLSNGSLNNAFLSPPNPGGAKIHTQFPGSPDFRTDASEHNTPQTPQVDNLPEDASRLTISGQRVLSRQHSLVGVSAAKPPPATPTTSTGRDLSIPDGGVTPVQAPKAAEVDEHLASRFEKVEIIGSGEFSDVFRVTKAQNFFFNKSSFASGTPGASITTATPPTPKTPKVFAVKKSRQPFTGPRDKERKMKEVEILMKLGNTEHVVNYIDHWDFQDHLYIQTEFCEEGSLDGFLATVGRKGRLDDFRIWKIMLELGEGLRHIHESGFIHLDLKPANVFITFEGVLKIGDFGMATSWPAARGIDGEGDREYIAPEILDGKYGKPADVFMLGLILLEIAGNVVLPENGPSWTKLRSGDMSDVPSLTWSNASSIFRDANGMPIVDDSDTSMDSFLSDDEMEDIELPQGQGRKRNYNPTKRSTSHDPANLFGSMRRGELRKAPAFMTDQYDAGSLDKVVKWMITPEPEHRPTIQDVLAQEGVLWVMRRRRAGATVFEGTWGPSEEVLGEDSEMVDV